MALLAVLMAAFAIMEARKPHPWTVSAENAPAATPVAK
jgi:hypothetical protein